MQTLYVDTSILDVAPCFMLNNANAIKMHKDARDKFLNTVKNPLYWNTD